MTRHICILTDCAHAAEYPTLMCPGHWDMVPQLFKSYVSLFYTPGQYEADNPSMNWLRAADACINYVTMLEGNWTPGIQYECSICMEMQDIYLGTPVILKQSSLCSHHKLRKARH